ncbi:YdcF family protein [Tetragenococcus muriaticus]|uniref:YdcF family protein n=1 Tax=Tetragenococcus muriaticus TaxID=64642 RepID=UPI0003FAB0BF|nr:ElyC/SanA/YdcF family protein [Tetragenococcus muriaticus]GMA45772.1 membrane protein [Tetragenococcus muriaticus]GMA46857.1 membrane protein [Tetragenococcus muriaticus]
MVFGHVPWFILAYLLLIFILTKRYKKQHKPRLFWNFVYWTFLYLSLYLGMIEVQNGSYFFLVPCLFFAIFAWVFQREKARVINGFLFNFFIGIFGLYLLYNFFITSDIIVFSLIFLVGILFFAVALFGFIGLIILFYWNALVVIRRETHSLANLLTLILAVLMTIWLIYDSFIIQMLPEWATLLLSVLPAMFIYFVIAFLNFFSASVLYQFNQPSYSQDFIIVLGAGLVGGDKVSPLLANRIQRAITFYYQQRKNTRHPVKFIMSGGKGHDEKVAEAVAMKKYALQQGIQEEDILIETNSTTTLENMQFSKEIIDRSEITDPSVIFSSNNYHIFRAGIFAKMAHLKAEGIGSKTAFYYLPNAFLREFIAIIAMKRKFHFTMVTLLGSGLLLLSIISQFSS